jgi:hypothetical protein
MMDCCCTDKRSRRSKGDPESSSVFLGVLMTGELQGNDSGMTRGMIRSDHRVKINRQVPGSFSYRKNIVACPQVLRNAQL